MTYETVHLASLGVALLLIIVYTKITDRSIQSLRRAYVRLRDSCIDLANGVGLAHRDLGDEVNRIGRRIDCVEERTRYTKRPCVPYAQRRPLAFVRWRGRTLLRNPRFYKL